MDARVPRPVYELLWRSIHVEAPIAEFLTVLEFTDNLHGQADELALTLEDSQGFFSGAKADYYPKLGDDLSLSLGYDSGDLKGMWSAGVFMVDEIRVFGPPDQVSMRALSSTNKKAVRQRGSRAWRKAKLKEIVHAAAKTVNMTVEGLLPDVTLERCVRNDESVMSFLCRLGDEYGFCVKAAGDSEIVAHSLKDFLGREVVLTLERKDLAGYELITKTGNTARNTVVRSWDPLKKDKILYRSPGRTPIPVEKVPLPNSTAKQAGGSQVPGVSAEDVAVILDRMESEAQAEARREARELRNGMRTAEATLTLMGDPRLRAGMKVTLKGFGTPSGNYIITRAHHRFERGKGYETSIDLMKAT